MASDAAFDVFFLTRRGYREYDTIVAAAPATAAITKAGHLRSVGLVGIAVTVSSNSLRV